MRHEKSNITNILAGTAIGAGCMYLFDPGYGKRRRAFVYDKAVHFSRMVENGTGVVVRDLTNRTWGVAASVSRVFRRKPSDDSVLEPRVRSEMGRWVSNPHSIHVEAQDGCVILSGDILASEEKEFVHRIERIPGVDRVENRLKTHSSTENLLSLQGATRREPKFELLQTNWAPGPRVLAGISGAAIMGKGLRNGGIIGWGVTTLGALLLFRAATNISLTQWIGRKESGESQGSERNAGETGIPIKRVPESPEYRVH